MNKILKGIAIGGISVLTLGGFYKYLNSGGGKITAAELAETIDGTKYFDGIGPNAQKWGVIDSLQMKPDSANDILIQQGQEIAKATNGKVYLISSNQTPLDMAKEIIMDLDKNSDLIIMVDVTTSMTSDGDLNNAASALLSMIEIMRQQGVRVAVYVYTDDQFPDGIHGTQIVGLDSDLSPEDIIFRIKSLGVKEQNIETSATLRRDQEYLSALNEIVERYASNETTDTVALRKEVEILDSKKINANRDPLETPFSGAVKAIDGEETFGQDGRQKVILLVGDAGSKVGTEGYIKKCIDNAIITNVYPVLIGTDEKLK